MRSRLMKEALKDFGDGCKFLIEAAICAAIATGLTVLALESSLLIAAPLLFITVLLIARSIPLVLAGLIMTIESTPTIVSGGRYWPKSRSRFAQLIGKVLGVDESD